MSGVATSDNGSARPTTREGSVGALVDELSRRLARPPRQPIGLLFELIGSDRPPVQVIDGVQGEQPWT